MSSIPERWARRLVERGYVDRRGSKGDPSLSALADASGVSTTTISNAIRGSRATSVEVVAALVDKLGPDVADWIGSARIEEWTPPAEASLLTDRQRKAVEELIRAMTERREDVGNDERSASTNQAGQSGTITDLIGRQAGVAEQTRRAARRGRVPANPLEHAGEEHQGEAPDEGG